MGAPTPTHLKVGGQMLTITREFAADSTAVLRALDTVREVAVDFEVADRMKRRLMRISEWAGLRRRREALRRFAQYEVLESGTVRHIATGEEFTLDGTGWCSCADSQHHCKPIWRAMDKLLCGSPPRCLHAVIREINRSLVAGHPVYADASDFIPIGTRLVTGEDAELRFGSRAELLSYLLGRIGSDGIH